MKIVVENMKKIPMFDIVESPQQQLNRTKGFSLLQFYRNRKEA